MNNAAMMMMMMVMMMVRMMMMMVVMMLPLLHPFLPNSHFCVISCHSLTEHCSWLVVFARICTLL